VDYIHLLMDTLFMAVPARRADVEHPMDVEARLTGLEQQTKHLQSDVAEIKSNLVRMDAKIDGVKDSVNALGQKVAALEPKLNSMEALFDSKLGTMEAKLGTMEALFDSKLGTMEAKLGTMETLFDSKLGTMEVKLGTVEAKLDAKLSAVQAAMTRWMIGIILAIAAAALGKPLLELAGGAQPLNGRNDVGVQSK
jgi:uncharacterized coiled-coil protein SlyX